MDTKDLIVRSAIELLSSNLPPVNAGGEQSRQFSAASRHYDFVLGNEVENYLYQFTITLVPLVNPTTGVFPERSGIRYYDKPQNLGEIFGVFPNDQVSSALQLLQARGKNNIGTIHYISVGNYIQVSSADQNLTLVYSNRNPDPISMSVSFKDGLRHRIASLLAVDFTNNRRLSAQFAQQAQVLFEKARRYDSFGINKIEQADAPTLDETLEFGSPSGSTRDREYGYGLDQGFYSAQIGGSQGSAAAPSSFLDLTDTPSEFSSGFLKSNDNSDGLAFSPLTPLDIPLGLSADHIQVGIFNADLLGGPGTPSQTLVRTVGGVAHWVDFPTPPDVRSGIVYPLVGAPATKADVDNKSIAVVNGNIRIAERYVASPEIPSHVSFQAFTSSNVAAGYTYRGVVSGVSLNRIPNPQDKQVIYYENTHQFYAYDATLIAAPVSQPIGWVPYSVTRYKGEAPNLIKAIDKVTANGDVIYRSDLSLVEVAFNYTTHSDAIYKYAWSPTHDIQNLLDTVSHLAVVGSFANVTMGTGQTPNGNYVFVGYAYSGSGFGPIGGIKGNMVNPVGGIYTVTKNDNPISALQTVLVGMSYISIKSPTDKHPIAIVINENFYKVGDVENTQYFRILNFIGFNNKQTYRIQIVFADGSIMALGTSLEKFAESDLSNLSGLLTSSEKLSIKDKLGIHPTTLSIGVIPASIKRSAYAGRYTLILHGIEREMYPEVTKLRIVVQGTPITTINWTFATGGVVIPFTITQESLRNAFQSLHRTAQHIDVQVLFRDSSDNDVYSSNLFTWLLEA